MKLITTDSGIRVRTKPTTTGDILFSLPKGFKFETQVFVQGSSIGGNTVWAEVDVNTVFAGATFKTQKAYITMRFLAEDKPIVIVPPPPPPSTGTIIGSHPALPFLNGGQRFGLHNFNWIEDSREQFDQGCRLFTIMDNLTGAREMRDKGAGVFYRKYQNARGIEPWQHLASMGLSPTDRLVVLGINEGDIIADSSLEWRFNWDVRFANEVWKNYPNCIPSIGGWAMGNPAVDVPEFRGRWAATYGKFLNENAHRVVVNYHSYDERWKQDAPAGNPPRPYFDPRWLSLRFYVDLYDTGILSPSVVMISDETFIDFGGGGGSAWANYNEQNTIEWYQFHKRSGLFARPYFYGGTAYHGVPPHKRQEWAGYSTAYLRGAFMKIWRNEV